MFFLQAVLLQAAVLSCKLQESLTLQGVQDAADAPPYPAAHSLQLSAERLPAAAVVVPTGQSAQGDPTANDPSEKEPSLPAEQKSTAGDMGEKRTAVGGSSAGAAYNVLSQQHAMRTLLSVVCCLLRYDRRWACNKVSPCICIPGKTTPAAAPGSSMSLTLLHSIWPCAPAGCMQRAASSTDSASSRCCGAGWAPADQTHTHMAAAEAAACVSAPAGVVCLYNVCCACCCCCCCKQGHFSTD